MKNNKIIDVLKIIWVVLVVVGGIYYIYKNYSETLYYLSTIKLYKLLLAALFIAIMRVLNVELIQQSLAVVGWKPGLKKAFSFVSISQLGKYIPGGVWQFVARFDAYKKGNVTYKNMGKAFIVENVWVVIGAFFTSLAFLFFSKPNEFLQKYGYSLESHWFILLGIGCLVLWLVALLIIELLFKPHDQSLSPRRIAKLFLSQSLMWICNGLSLFFLFSNVYDFRDVLFSIGSGNLSYLAGYIVIIAPGGIGVREVVAVLLFSTLFTEAEISTYLIVHRLLYTFIEFLLAGIASIFEIRNRKINKSVKE